MICRAPLALSLLLGIAGTASAGPVRQCVGESERLVGQRARLADGSFPSPRKRHDEPFVYPTRQGSTKGSGIWIGEALVDQAGKVRGVWTVRPFRFEPAWPEFDDAIAAGISRWTYEPTVAEGSPVPVCLTVSVNIDWK
jgi:hypothetical protein